MKREHVVIISQRPFGWNMPSLSSRTLATYLTNRFPEERLRVTALDYPSLARAEDILEELVDLAPDVAGFSCYLWNHQDLMEIAARLKRRLPGVAIMAGGPQLSYDAPDLERFFGRYPEVDVLIQGEGELVLTDYLRLPPDARPRGQTVLQGMKLECLDDIGTSPFERYPCELDEQGRILHADAYLPLESGRGCKYRCAYCTFRKTGNDYRTKSLAQLRREIDWARRHSAKKIMFTESLFNLDGQRFLDCISLIEELGVAATMGFLMFLDYNLLTREHVRMLSRLVVEFEIGLQSLNPVPLRLARRPYPNRKFTQVLEWCAEFGISPVVAIILGLPGDTLQEFKNTFSFLTALDVQIETFLLRVLPGSDFYYRRDKLGLQYDERTGRILQTPTMSEADFQAAIEFILERDPSALALERDLFPYDREALGKTPTGVKPLSGVTGGHGPMINPMTKPTAAVRDVPLPTAVRIPDTAPPTSRRAAEAATLRKLRALAKRLLEHVPDWMVEGFEARRFGGRMGLVARLRLPGGPALQLGFADPASSQAGFLAFKDGTVFLIADPIAGPVLPEAIRNLIQHLEAAALPPGR